MAIEPINAGRAPIIWSTVDEAFAKINQNFSELDLRSSGSPSELNNGVFTVALDENGNLNLPAGGDILDSDGNSVLGSSSDPAIWVDVLTSNQATVSPFVVASTEYDSVGNIIATALCYIDGGPDFTTVLKISPSGSILNQIQFTALYAITGWGVAVGSDNEVYVSGTADNNIFIIKLDNELNEQWSINFGAEGGVFEEGCVIDVPIDGNPVIVGRSSTTTDDIIVMKISSVDGSVLWQRIVGTGLTTERSYGMAVGPNNEVVAIGLYSNEFFDSQLVVKFDSTGTLLWQKSLRLDEGFECIGADADIDSLGNIYVLGNYDWSTGDQSGTGVSITKFNSSGVAQWTRKIQGPCNETSASIVCGDDGYIYLSATTGILVGENLQVSQLLAKYDSSGTIVWQRIFKESNKWTITNNFFGSGGNSNLDVANGVFVLGSISISPFFGGSYLDWHGVIFNGKTSGVEANIGPFIFKASGLSGSLTTPFAVTDLTLDNNPGNLIAAPLTPISNIGSIVSTKYQTGFSTGDITFDGVKIIGTASEGKDGLISLIPATTSNTGFDFESYGQYVNIYPTTLFDSPHIHITAGEGSNGRGDLFLGDDQQYVEIANTGVINIRSYDADSAASASWSFSGNGNLTFPDSTIQTTAWTGTASVLSRTTVFASTTSLADGASGNLTIVGYKGYALYKVETSAAAWVRIYTDTASRAADAGRSELTDPLPGAGIIAEVITTGAETVLITPGTIGFSNESTPDTNIQLAVTNKSGSTAAITVTLTVVQLEA